MNTTQISHLTAGARGLERLVQDDRDRWDLLGRARVALGTSLLAWCMMGTHMHVVAEGPPAAFAARLEAALLAYTRAHNRRHGRSGRLLRGPVVATPVPGAFELGRAIRYVHENPVTAGLVESAVHWPWSSARAFAGLARPRHARVARARALVDPRASRMLGRPHPLATAGPLEVPLAHPGAIFLAAAQALEVDPATILGRARAPAPTAGRALFVRLGILEGYEHRQLAPTLDVTRQRVSQLASVEVEPIDLRRARTLLRDPDLREHLDPCPAGKSDPRSRPRVA